MNSENTTRIYESLVKELGPSLILSLEDPAQFLSPDPKKQKSGDPFILILASGILPVATRLRNHADFLFEQLLCLSALDEKGEEEGQRWLSVVYQLYSLKHRQHCMLKTRLPVEAPEIESVSKIWQSANWFEREAYDLMGIQFRNHPDLRRIMLPPDWIGHPLRKDYEYPTEYNGINNVRPKLSEIHKEKVSE